MKPNYSSFSWIGKYWEVQLQQDSKILNLNLLMNWENLCPNLSFTVQNEMGNLHKTRLFTFHWQCMRYSITSMNWEKYVFHSEKSSFKPIVICTYHRIFGLKNGPQYLYWLFDVLPKQATCEMKTRQLQVSYTHLFRGVP